MQLPPARQKQENLWLISDRRQEQAARKRTLHAHAHYAISLHPYDTRR